MATEESSLRSQSRTKIINHWMNSLERAVEAHVEFVPDARSVKLATVFCATSIITSIPQLRLLQAQLPEVPPAELE